MHKKFKRLCVVVAAVLVAGFGLLNIVAYRHAYAMTHFTSGGNRTMTPEELTLRGKIRILVSGVNLPRPETKLSPQALSPEAKSLSIACADGVTLGTWYCGNANAMALVILYHGYAGEKTGLLNEARAFLELGVSVLLVDFRGSGDSSESYTTIGVEEAEDVEASVTYARKNLPHSSVILYGQSMGAAAILRAVHSDRVRPDGIIVEAVFDRMIATVRNRFQTMAIPSFPSAELLVFWGGWQAGFNGFDHSPMEYAASVACPMLFLQGAQDSRARIEDARRVFGAVSAPKEFKEFPGLGHAPVLGRFPSQWKDNMSRFLAKTANRTVRRTGAIHHADEPMQALAAARP